jgi:hypothetical protein
MHAALARRGSEPGSAPVVDKQACRAYAEAARQRLKARVAEERGEQPALAR